jgi:hypothetical protein
MLIELLADWANEKYWYSEENREWRQQYWKKQLTVPNTGGYNQTMTVTTVERVMKDERRHCNNCKKSLSDGSFVVTTDASKIRLCRECFNLHCSEGE